jgi:acyl-CoA reductase-like NAD-dependent aldehyde dehydrogenase
MLAAIAVFSTGGVAGGLLGYFVPPTVLHVDPQSRIAQEEVFGPVLSVIAYDSVEEAVAIANGTPYGLAGAVWGPDDASALKVARQLRAGQVDVNGAFFNPSAPFGGFGMSGVGRENGPLGLAEFVEPVSITESVGARRNRSPSSRARHGGSHQTASRTPPPTSPRRRSPRRSCV